MNLPLPNDRQSQLNDLYEEMAPEHLTPLWEVLSALVLSEPKSPARAHKWTYDAARNYLLRAGDLISAEQAERRVLILENPGLEGLSSITPSLYAGLQLVLPGEVAPCHRHTQCALRFVMEGEGAYTAINGEKAVMRPFDLILTPGGRWHDHGNDTASPIIWLDGLDIPTVRHFDASFAEKYPEPQYPQGLPDGATFERYGRNMRPMGATVETEQVTSPLFHYPYSEWRASLDALASSGEPDAHLGYALEFTNPADGGSIMPTIGAHVRLLPAGFETLERRSTDGGVFVVIEGCGEARIAGETIRLSPRDVFVVPSWLPMTLKADKPLVLFGFSDKPCQEKLHLFRELNA
jgi:gentisate 1,2-dioxygenase